MFKKIIVFNTLIFILISCSNKSNMDIVPVDSTKSFSVLGYCTPVPENSFNVKYSIVNKTIAESNFDYNNINFYYRASKNLGELLVLYDNLKEYKTYTDNETSTEIIMETYDKEYVAHWNVKGIYYSLSGEDENELYNLSLILIKNKALN
ncbi:hypothetical protein [Brachyspira murdochii]|uniref:Lipoprotein n=1 Tax=Brachyspira murdochii (strain ATCC 51284 / DSM 12563 / 56-150) TaxID=526224 RepID=D5U5S7_BRAM5|nr:hypothetical protein [Brachyspira murdochii]ADG70418.1 conserved hypothetical protein [Brachyspira murdochii DSM 12563]